MPTSFVPSFRDQLPCAPISIGGRAVAAGAAGDGRAFTLYIWLTHGRARRTDDEHRFDGVTADAAASSDVTRECVVVSYLTLYRVIYETRVLFLVLLLHCAAAAAAAVPSTETASNNSGRFEMPELFMAHSQEERGELDVPSPLSVVRQKTACKS